MVGINKKQQMPEQKQLIIPKERDSKDIAVETLQQHGYNALIQDGVVVCQNISETTFKEITNILKGIGYTDSYGVMGTGEIVAEPQPKKEVIKKVGKREIDPKLQELYDKGVNVYSISRVDTISDCLYSAYRTYILKEKGHGNVYSSAGSVIHQVLEDITNGKATEKDLLPSVQDELDNLESLGIEWPKDSNGGDSIRDNWLTNITNFCKTYIPPKGKKLKTEELFIYTTPNKKYVLQGYIDLQQERKDGSIAIYDYKSSSMYTGDEFKSHARQLILYALGKEQEGYKVHSASWIFLKWVTVKFMGKKTVRSKEKTEIVKNIERRKIAQELESYLTADLKESGYGELDIEMMIEKYKKTLIMEGSIPDEVAANYTIRPCVISVDLTNEAKQETIDYIESTIEKWEALDPDNEYEYPPKKFTKKQKNGREVRDTYFCRNLCNHGDKCPYLHDFEEQYAAEEENDDIF